MPYGKKSPAEMGHSPMKKESAKQEKKNLLKDMPVDKRASAMQMGHESPAKNIGHGMKSIKDKSASKHNGISRSNKCRKAIIGSYVINMEVCDRYL